MRLSQIEATTTCDYEWHEADLADDDNHHCSRPTDHTGPHLCGWCQELGR